MNMRNLFEDYIYPIATIAGSIIGVGFFALPYIAMKAGIWTMLFYFIILGGIIIFIHLIFGEICLKTPDFKRFPGFAGFYLGKWGKLVALMAIITGSFGTLLAYLIVGGEFLTSILSPVIGHDNLFYTLIYFALASAIVYLGIKAVSKFEFWALVALFISFLVIFIKGFAAIKLENIFTPDFVLQPANLFLPYGVVLFSLWGTGLIPEAEEMLGQNRKHLLKKIIVISSLAPIIVYLVFIFLILGITGQSTTESALVGIKNFFGNGVASTVLIIGVITTFTAFIAQALTLKKVFMYDLGIKKMQAWIITCFTPLMFFMLGLKSFIGLISLTGGVLLGITGILILLMYKKIGGKKIIIYPLSLVFLLGIVYEIIYFVK